MLTLFTAPKPFVGHIGVIQENALRSWKALGSDVDIVVLGDEPGLAQAAADLGVIHLDSVDRAESGAPRLRSVLAAARGASHQPCLCYLNADIILLADFLPAVRRVAERLTRFLLLGQRWDLDVTEPLSFDPGWERSLRENLGRAGRLHRPVGSDYFVFPADIFVELPDFILGRSGWDNWMIFEARRRRIPVVDATAAVTIVHQNHDYAHLPGGQKHHRHPESQVNLDLAGGRETIFRIEDADWRLTPRTLQRKGPFDWRYPRKWEADLIARLGPGKSARLVRMVFRPRQALRSLRGAAGASIDESAGEVVGEP